MPITWFEDKIQERVPSSSLVGHYTTLDTFLEKIFRGGALRLGRLSETNDPRENKKWSFAAVRGELEGFDQANELLNELRSRCYVACATRHKEDYKCFCHPALWRHYGDNHKGVCLLFNSGDMDQRVRNFALTGKSLKILDRPGKNVNYSTESPFTDPPPDVSQDVNVQVQELLNQYSDYFVFQKHPDWQNEIEYRWLMISNDSKSNGYLVPFESSLVGVVFGADVSDTEARAVSKMISPLETAKMKWNVFMDEGLALRCF